MCDYDDPENWNDYTPVCSLTEDELTDDRLTRARTRMLAARGELIRLNIEIRDAKQAIVRWQEYLEKNQARAEELKHGELAQAKAEFESRRRIKKADDEWRSMRRRAVDAYRAQYARQGYVSGTRGRQLRQAHADPGETKHKALKFEIGDVVRLKEEHGRQVGPGVFVVAQVFLYWANGLNMPPTQVCANVPEGIPGRRLVYGTLLEKIGHYDVDTGIYTFSHGVAGQDFPVRNYFVDV